MNKFLLIVVLCFNGISSLQGQDIRKYYVSKSDGESTIYHLFPCSLFKNDKMGDLTFDITYRDHSDGMATINFTYEMNEVVPVDSVRFVSGRTIMQGSVQKIYISPEKKHWKHRYGFVADVRSLYTFFDVSASPEAILYCGGKSYLYKVKTPVWRTYAPVGSKTFGMIRINEQH